MSSGKTVERIFMFSERHQPAAAEYQAAAGTMENQALEDRYEGVADSTILKTGQSGSLGFPLSHSLAPMGDVMRKREFMWII